MKETEEGIFLTPEDCDALVRFQAFLAGVVLLIGILIGWRFL